MGYYSTAPLDDATMRSMAGTECIGFGAGESHERIIQSAGGEIGYDGFMDPRPGQSGKMKADRVFINQRENKVQGINFRKNGEFCCSYTGMDYEDIKDSNRRDVAEKMKREESTSESKTLQKQRSDRLSAAPSESAHGPGVADRNTAPSQNNKLKH